MSSINLKPNKPDSFEGTRDFLTLNNWLYTIEQYLSLTRISVPTISITDHNKIAIASSYLKGNAAIWLYNKVNSSNIPATWEAFKNAISTEFIPADHTQRAREKFKRLKQVSSVEKYLSEYRNFILMIGNTNEGEKLDRFIDGLKYQVKVEVLKANCESFEDCARVALNIDSAIWRAKRGPNGFYNNSQDYGNTPVPMEIGNVNAGPSKSHQEQQQQRKRDLSRGVCFKCHKVGCRPWKCNPTKVKNVTASANNDEPEEGPNIFSDSENE